MKKILLTIALFFSMHSIYAQCWQTIDAGGQHALAIKQDNKLWGWGDNQYGQVGSALYYPCKWPVVHSITAWKKISAGATHSVGITFSGIAYAWGQNASAQLGVGNFNAMYVSPQTVNTNRIFKEISAGQFHTVGIIDSGRLWGWGSNSNGQLSGVGGAYPMQIGTDSTWKSVSAGYMHTLLIKENGTLWATGNNGNGQVGNGTFVQVDSIVQIGVDSNWLMVSGGSQHSLALKKDSTLWGWGKNNYGAVGDGTQVDKNVPTQIGAANTWKSVSAGFGHSLAVKWDGTLWGWGRNWDGEAGDSNYGHFLVPTKIGNASDWASVSAGEEFSIAIKQNGYLWTWGTNYNGELGDSTLNTVRKPHAIYTPNCIPMSVPNPDELETKISISPNPVCDVLKVHLPQEMQIANTTYSIRNVLGQYMQSGSFANGVNIQVLDFAKGIYILKIMGTTLKFVKE